MQLATVQKLARYWETEYDWRKCEAKLNALPQFITEIDGVDIHFIHVRSKHPNALPMIVTHGWPGSIIEQLKIIDPLTKRLGYTRFVAQGGDWGNAVTEQMSLLGAPELIGIHTNMPATVPDDINTAALAGAPAPAGLSADEKHAYDQLAYFYKHGLGYANEMANRPQTLYGIGDSPVGMAAWMLDHDASSLALITRVFDGQPEGLTRDDVLDNVTLYWLTNTTISSARLYWESKLPFFCPERRSHPSRGKRLSGGALSGPAELDPASVSQAHLLQQARQGRPLRGLGTAGASGVGPASGVQITPLTITQRKGETQM